MGLHPQTPPKTNDIRTPSRLSLTRRVGIPHCFGRVHPRHVGTRA